MSDPKKAYPQGWKQMYEELKLCMQKTKKPFKAMALLTQRTVKHHNKQQAKKGGQSK